MPRADELLYASRSSDAADRPVRTYSGGMRGGWTSPRLWSPEPPVLFLDEPTTGLDLTSRNELWDMIRELVADGTTVLLTTQYLEEADQLAAPHRGRRRRQGDRRRHAGERLKSQLGDTVVELGFGDEATADRAAIGGRSGRRGRSSRPRRSR